MSLDTEIPVRVAEVTPVADRVKRFRFERLDGKPMPYLLRRRPCRRLDER